MDLSLWLVVLHRIPSLEAARLRLILGILQLSFAQQFVVGVKKLSGPRQLVLESLMTLRNWLRRAMFEEPEDGNDRV